AAPGETPRTSGSSEGTDDSTPIRCIRSRCCPRAATGHATAAPPTSLMNSRRHFTGPVLLVLPMEWISHLTIAGDAALRDFNPPYDGFGSRNEPARAGARCARSTAGGCYP